MLKVIVGFSALLVLFVVQLRQAPLSGFTYKTLVILDNSAHKGGYQLLVLVQDFVATHEGVRVCNK